MIASGFKTACLCGLGAILCASIATGAEKINFEDHLQPILRNECTSCHNPDKKKGGLDLSSYTALMAGGDSGSVVSAGDPDNSKLYKVVAHLEDPYMPKGKLKLQDGEIGIFQKWIAGGALPTANGKPVIAKAKPRLDLAVAAADTGKPSGPPAMPRDLLIEPVVHTRRPGALACLASSPWAPLVAVGGQHQVLLYNTDTLDLLAVIPYPNGDPYVTTFSRNGSVLLVGGGVSAKSGCVELFDVVTGRKITRIGDEFDAVLAADISPDQSTVALGGPGKTLKIYSTSDGQLLQAIKKHTDWVTAIAYSPDGVLLASGDRAGGLWVWEAKSGNEFYGLSGHKGAITSVCFRADSNILASASEDGTVKLWDMQSGKLVKSWRAHPSGVLSVSFAHDGRIVTCGRDRVVREWRPDGGGLLTTRPFNDIALHATFDADGKRIVAGDWTGAIRVFDAKSGKALGDLTADPPRIEDQLASCRKLLPEAQAAKDKSAAELGAAWAASDKAAIEFQAANVELAEAELALQGGPQAQKQRLGQLAEAARKRVEARTGQARHAARRLARAKPAAAHAEQGLVELQARVGHLDAAQFNVKVWDARHELAARQAEFDKLTQAARAAEAAERKAREDLDRARNLTTHGPQLIAQAGAALQHARDLLADAAAGQKAAQALLEQKLAQATDAALVAEKLSDEAARDPADSKPAHSAPEAKAAFDDLNHAVESADQLLLARTALAAQMGASVKSSQAALKAEMAAAAAAAAPASIASLKTAAAKAATQLDEMRAALAHSTTALAAAKARADQLVQKYQQLKQQVSMLAHGRAGAGQR